MSLELNELDKIRLEKFLYEEENKTVIIDFLKSTENHVFLHLFADDYNWDNGLEIPTTIANNKNCDLGTALLLFFRAEGEVLLGKGIEINGFDEKASDWRKEWKFFLIDLYEKITNGEYKNKKITFDPKWTKVERYKLLKKNPNIPNVFMEASPGENIDF